MEFPLQELDHEETERLLSDAVNYGADLDSYTVRNRRVKKRRIVTNVCK